MTVTVIMTTYRRNSTEKEKNKNKKRKTTIELIKKLVR